MVPDGVEPIGIVIAGTGLDHHRNDLWITNVLASSVVEIAVLFIATGGLTVVVPNHHGNAGEVGCPAEELQIVLTEGVGTLGFMPYAAILT